MSAAIVAGMSVFICIDDLADTSPTYGSSTTFCWTLTTISLLQVLVFEVKGKNSPEPSLQVKILARDTKFHVNIVVKYHQFSTVAVL